MKIQYIPVQISHAITKVHALIVIYYMFMLITITITLQCFFGGNG